MIQSRSPVRAAFEPGEKFVGAWLRPHDAIVVLWIASVCRSLSLLNLLVPMIVQGYHSVGFGQTACPVVVDGCALGIIIFVVSGPVGQSGGTDHYCLKEESF